jgi:hypothetical protein
LRYLTPPERVGEKRRREAVDRLTAVQFDRHGNRIWHQAKALLDSEHARRAVGEVAVPFGGCAEPSNVKAGGHACPYRFRCAGCDHFRTDASYLLDLTAYLDDLLRTQERLAAAASLDEWARVSRPARRPRTRRPAACPHPAARKTPVRGTRRPGLARVRARRTRRHRHPQPENHPPGTASHRPAAPAGGTRRGTSRRPRRQPRAHGPAQRWTPPVTSQPRTSISP